MMELHFHHIRTTESKREFKKRRQTYLLFLTNCMVIEVYEMILHLLLDIPTVNLTTKYFYQ